MENANYPNMPNMPKAPEVGGVEEENVHHTVPNMPAVQPYFHYPAHFVPCPVPVSPILPDPDCAIRSILHMLIRIRCMDTSQALCRLSMTRVMKTSIMKTATTDITVHTVIRNTHLRLMDLRMDICLMVLIMALPSNGSVPACCGSWLHAVQRS